MKIDKDDKPEKPELILWVEKPIWLAVEKEPVFKILEWTTIKPKYDNGFIDKGSILIFSYLYSSPEGEGLNFIEIRPGQEYESRLPEFNQAEIDSLTKEGTLTLLRLEDIEEISIMMGEVFIKYFDYIAGKQLSFDTKVFSPKDLYIIMGPEEFKLSHNRIKVGEKISLKRLLQIYSTAVGQNLVLK
jgi:hypothetical protein